MNKKISFILFILIILFFILTFWSNKNANIKSQGDFSNSTIVTTDYNISSREGFYASLDFELKQGKVDWEIINPNGESVFKGYVAIDNGNVYRELTYPSNFLDGNLNIKNEITNTLDFDYLQFETGNLPGIYKLNITPINAEGSYTVEWINKLPSK